MGLRKGVCLWGMSLLTLTGCGEMASIYHNNAISRNTDAAQVSVLTVDAKQRHVLISMPPKGATKWGAPWPASPITVTVTDPAGKETGKVTIASAEGVSKGDDSKAAGAGTPPNKNVGTWPRMCAEPAPDVFSAYSGSASGDMNIALVNTGVTDKSANAAGKFAGAFGETAAAIERTQSLNLIRESMYRTCERYLNGAITEDELIIQAARDHRAMLAFLTIEQLTSPLRPAPIVISGPGVGAGIGGIDAAKELKTALKDQVDADSQLTTSKAAVLAAADGAKGKDCTKKPDADDPVCKTLIGAQSDLKKATDIATLADNSVKQWTIVVSAASGGGNATVTAAAATILNQQTPSQAQLNNVVAVSGTVKAVFTEANNFNEIMMVCVVKMRATPPDPFFKDLCESFFEKEVARYDLENTALTDQLNLAINKKRSEQQTAAEAFIEKVKQKIPEVSKRVEKLKAFIESETPVRGVDNGAYYLKGFPKEKRIYANDVKLDNVDVLIVEADKRLGAHKELKLEFENKFLN